VVVRPYNLSGDISRDAGTINVGPVVTETTLELPNAYVKPPTQNERKLYTARTWEFKGSSIKLDPLINAISGRTKMLKKRVARDKKKALLLDRFYENLADSLFVYGLKIPKSNINDFMYFCEVDAEYVSLSEIRDGMKIWEFLRKKSMMYRKNNDLE